MCNLSIKVYSEFNGESGSVVEGVQQPYEISIVNGFEHQEISLASITAFPNPTIDFLQLKIESETVSNISVQLYDNQGKIMWAQENIDKETQVDMQQFSGGIYFVKVLSGNQNLKTFRIIKN